jgi:thiol-disulfide isomerase/thioredoxin
MKRGILIGIALAFLIALLFWADRRFPGNGRQGPQATESHASVSVENVSIKDLQDHDVRLSDYTGKVVLVNFWATWCAPCQVEIPWMIEFQEKYGPRGFTILGVSMDEDGKTAVVPFLQKSRFNVEGQSESINYPVLLGSDVVAEKFGGLIGLPTSMLFSRDGKKVRTITGLVDHDEMAKAIEGQL